MSRYTPPAHYAEKPLAKVKPGDVVYVRARVVCPSRNVNLGPCAAINAIDKNGQPIDSAAWLYVPEDSIVTADEMVAAIRRQR